MTQNIPTDHRAPIIVDHEMDIDTPDTNARLTDLAATTITDLLTLAQHEYNGESDGYRTQADLYADAAAHAHDLARVLDRLTQDAHEAGQNTP